MFHRQYWELNLNKCFIVDRALGKDDATFPNALIFVFKKKFPKLISENKEYLIL